MTNEKILQIALQQQAFDSNCRPEDFLSGENKVVISAKSSNARRYLELPFLCDLTSYGGNIVASVSPELYAIATEYINNFPVEHCFETPNIHVLMEKLKPYDMSVCFMAEYFLPKSADLTPLDCAYKTVILEPKDFENLYLPQWGNALCEKRKELDMLAVGAYDCGSLIGLAGASADCDTMWQIGIDVSSEYRRQGVASALTSRLAAEILKRDIVPFYCCAWSNIKSARNAIRSGFVPSWVQLTVKPNSFIQGMNQTK